MWKGDRYKFSQQCDYIDQACKNLSLWNRSTKNYKQLTTVNEKATITCCTLSNDPRKYSYITIIYVSQPGKNTSNSFALRYFLHCIALHIAWYNPQIRSSVPGAWLLQLSITKNNGDYQSFYKSLYGIRSLAILKFIE